MLSVHSPHRYEGRRGRLHRVYSGKIQTFQILREYPPPATAMHFKVDDVRIREIKELAPPRTCCGNSLLGENRGTDL